ncbi:hypothetical protein LCGC14_1405670 [marine sediment metagenome]|uniref:Uncharacterized protein n=1 Tax=marine sediment metagenome TaxID=412755 RepID=A0A0F9KGR1_9ZZZZ
MLLTITHLKGWWCGEDVALEYPQTFYFDEKDEWFYDVTY